METGRRLGTFRTREQAILIGITGVILIIAVPVQSLSADAEGNRLSPGEAIFFVGLGVPLGLFMVLRVARSGVVAFERGCRVVNPLRTRFIPWTEIAGFSLRPWGVFPLVGQVDLKDGSSVHVFGIEAPNPLTRPNNRSAHRLKDELNSLRSKLTSGED